MGTRVASLPSHHRSHLWRPIAAAVVALLVISGIVAWSDWRGAAAPTTKATTPALSLPTRTVAVGAVTVKLQPRHLDAAGAVFYISFDTHSANLNRDLVRQARLVVGHTTWNVAGWSGDGPGGHHREGELRFAAGGLAAGTATLNIDGLPKPLTATWQLGS